VQNETIEKARKCRELRASGQSLRKIAAAVGCGLATVQRLLAVPVHPAEAEIIMGELLAVPGSKNKGAIPGKTGIKGRPVLDDAPTLSEIGISKRESAEAIEELSLDLTEDLAKKGKETQGTRTDLLSKIDKKLPSHNTQKEIAKAEHQEPQVAVQEAEVQHAEPVVIAVEAEVQAQAPEVQTREDDPPYVNTGCPKCGCLWCDPVEVNRFFGRRRWRGTCQNCGRRFSLYEKSGE